MCRSFQISSVTTIIYSFSNYEYSYFDALCLMVLCKLFFSLYQPFELNRLQLNFTFCSFIVLKHHCVRLGRIERSHTCFMCLSQVRRQFNGYIGIMSIILNVCKYFFYKLCRSFSQLNCFILCMSVPFIADYTVWGFLMV